MATTAMTQISSAWRRTRSRATSSPSRRDGEQHRGEPAQRPLADLAQVQAERDVADRGHTEVPRHRAAQRGLRAPAVLGPDRPPQRRPAQAVPAAPVAADVAEREVPGCPPVGVDAHAVDARAAGDGDPPVRCPRSGGAVQPGAQHGERVVARVGGLAPPPRAPAPRASRSTSSGRSALATQALMCRATGCPDVPACCWTCPMSVGQFRQPGRHLLPRPRRSPRLPGRCRAASRPRRPAPRRSCCSRRRWRERRAGSEATVGPGQVGGVLGDQPVGELAGQVVLADQRVCEQRGRHPVPAAAQRGVTASSS